MTSRGLLVCTLLAACGGGSKKPVEPTPAPAPSGGGDDTAAARPAPPAPTATKSLYERLGGQPAITAVVAEFVANTTTDPRIKERFFNTDAENLKAKLVELVCVASGGPCKYTGKSMEDAHAGMDLVDDEFNALVEDLVKALDNAHVADADKQALLGVLGPMKPDIVTVH
jgi:hemoglobin